MGVCRTGIHHTSAGFPLELFNLFHEKISVVVVVWQAQPNFGRASWGQSYVTLLLSFCHSLSQFLLICFSLSGIGSYSAPYLLARHFKGLSSFSLFPHLSFFFFSSYLGFLFIRSGWIFKTEPGGCSAHTHTQTQTLLQSLTSAKCLKPGLQAPSKQFLNILQNTTQHYITGGGSFIHSLTHATCIFNLLPLFLLIAMCPYVFQQPHCRRIWKPYCNLEVCLCRFLFCWNLWISP